MKRNVIKYVIIVLIMIAAGVIYSCSNKESISLTDENKSGLDSAEELSSKEDMTETYSETESEGEKLPTKVCVYVCGAVNAPDVYNLDSHQRVVDAINAAGGFSEDADIDYLNLADVIVDGEKIYVPTEEEVAEGKVPETIATLTTGAVAGNTVSTSPKVNINTATLEELKTLNGIGDKRAQDIINYRSTHGGFSTIEDIKLVPGIKDAVFSKICDYIEV